MTTKADGVATALVDLSPSFGSGTSIVPFGMGDLSISDRRKIAEHGRKQLAGMLVQSEKDRVFKELLADAATKASHEFLRAQKNIDQVERTSRGTTYERSLVAFHEKLTYMVAGQLLGSQNVLGNSLVMIVADSPFPPEAPPAKPKGLLGRLFGS